MATIRATFSLDPGSVKTLEWLARRWQVPKSEALRRAIHSLTPGEPGIPTRKRVGRSGSS